MVNDPGPAASYPVAVMVTRIGTRRPRRIYMVEWRDKRGLTQQQLADRIGTTKESISRWETGKRQMNVEILAEVAHALDIDVPDLFRSPDQPTPADLLRDLPAEKVQQVIDYIGFVTRKTGS